MSETTETRVEWGVQRIQSGVYITAKSRQRARDIAAFEASKGEDYRRCRVIRRTVTTVTTDWEPA